MQCQRFPTYLRGAPLTLEGDSTGAAILTGTGLGGVYTFTCIACPEDKVVIY